MGSCTCGKIKFGFEFEPIEFARCHCSICKKLHQKPYVSYAKYAINETSLSINGTFSNIKKIIIDGCDNFEIIKSSMQAKRLACNKCHDILLMYYHNSENIWIVTDIFEFKKDHIPYYDIYN